MLLSCKPLNVPHIAGRSSLLRASRCLAGRLAPARAESDQKPAAGGAPRAGHMHQASRASAAAPAAADSGVAAPPYAQLLETAKRAAAAGAAVRRTSPCSLPAVRAEEHCCVGPRRGWSPFIHPSFPCQVTVSHCRPLTAPFAAPSFPDLLLC